MSCFHCDCKRPPDEFLENRTQEAAQRGPKKGPEKIAKSEVSNAWNFDFDDDESDGADVAAFEYADSHGRHEDSNLNSQPHGGNLMGIEDYQDKAGGNLRAHEREYSDVRHNRPGTGFDDFDDEDDDVDSYEIDTHGSNRSIRNASLNDFSDTEDIEGSNNNNFSARCGATPPSFSRPSRPMRRKAAFSGSEDDELGFDTDDDLSTHPNWKASHVADSQHRRKRGATGMSRGLNFGSDDDFDVDDDSDDDLRSRQTKGRTAGPKSFRSKADFEDDSFSGFEYNSDTPRNRFGGNKMESSRGSGFKGRGGFGFVRDEKYRSGDNMGIRRSSMNNGRKRSSQGDDYINGWEKNNRGGGSRNFKGSKRGGGSGYGDQPRGKSYKYGGDNDGDSSEFRNSRRVIER